MQSAIITTKKHCFENAWCSDPARGGWGAYLSLGVSHSEEGKERRVGGGSEYDLDVFNKQSFAIGPYSNFYYCFFTLKVANIILVYFNLLQILEYKYANFKLKRFFH